MLTVALVITAQKQKQSKCPAEEQISKMTQSYTRILFNNKKE